MSMLIGVTGSFGSGKTTVARMFAGLGSYVIDADKISYSLMLPRSDTYRRIVRRFSRSILRKDKKIDRKKLARLVFKDRTKLKLLNKTIHPEVIREIKRIIRANRKEKFIIIDAALLVESNFYKKMDLLITVRTNRRKQINRVMRAEDMTKEAVLSRLRTQAPLKKKLALADFIIDNSVSKRKTKIQVMKIWRKIRGGICR